MNQLQATIIQINTKMLSDRRNKENVKNQSGIKEGSNLLHCTVQGLREEIASLQQEKMMMQKEWIGEVELLRLQLGEYKKKLATVTDRYLLETYTKERHSGVNHGEANRDFERVIREKDIVIDQEKENKKRVQEELKRIIDENMKLKKDITMLKYEKDKNMEIGLIEKIETEQKNRLLQEEVKSKKNIISTLKRELDKIYSEREDVNKKERVIEQKSKQLECYSKEINEYNRLNQMKMKQQLQHLSKENDFLKSHIKKLEKMAKKDCKCDMKEEKVNENLFQIKRELALAKVKLGQSFIKQASSIKTKKKLQECSSESSDNQSNFSYEHKRK